MPECEKPIATSSGPSSEADISIMCASSNTLVRMPMRRNLWATSRAICADPPMP